ncbi:MAG: hypothetical protein D6755_03220 [Anaerolineae bacterium]|nr:MAG: hypothetical protein D6755_03220 [Anaerolineae bacterium]
MGVAVGQGVKVAWGVGVIVGEGVLLGARVMVGEAVGTAGVKVGETWGVTAEATAGVRNSGEDGAPPRAAASFPRA